MHSSTFPAGRRCAVACCTFLLGCATEVPPPATDSAAASHSPVAWALDVPPFWDDRVELVDSVPGTGDYRSARLFNYTPRDSTGVAQTLLGVFVYDSATWAAAKSRGGPPLGDSLTAVRGHVFIASLPQSNPFRQGSADARTFDSLAVSIETVRKGFRVAR